MVINRAETGEETGDTAFNGDGRRYLNRRDNILAVDGPAGNAVSSQSQSTAVLVNAVRPTSDHTKK